ncbi:MAG TPA: hypothetical protein VH087_12725 [Thermoanaerobaculia bacterium]|jgi:hypothetical protein|nr:hypothetical protein [Thermoanaerobaculia bacterium]
MKSHHRLAVIALALLFLAAAPEAVKLLNEGIATAKRGDLRRAEALIAKAIAIDPHEAPDYPVHYWHGVVLSGLGDAAGAQKEWIAAGQSSDVKRRLVSLKVAAPQQRAENARSDAFVLDARKTKSFQAGEEAMKAGKYDAAGELYARALNEPRPQLYKLALPPPKPTTTMAVESTTMSQTTATAPDENAKIDAEFAALSPGTVAFNAPDAMKVSETETVTVRIAPKGQASGITSGLPGETSTAAQEHITPKMQVTLDGLGFDIAALSPDTQTVAGGGFAEWRWNVTATTSGDHNLNVTIYAKLDDLPPHQIGAQTHPVRVDGNPMAGIGDFLDKNWQWLASAIVIPLIALLWNRRAKRKR